MVTARRIFVNYHSAPLYNSALSFTFWLMMYLAGITALYLFLVYISDKYIKTSGTNHGDPSKYNDVVRINMSKVPILGAFLY